MPTKDLILVLGFARSGTSALTRVISLCGCSLPKEVFGDTYLNPTGHWEPVDATNLNVDFVSQLGVVGDPSMRLEEMSVDKQVREAYIERIQALLRAYPRAPVVIKEFRINELMVYWKEAARREGYTVKVVVALRHPHEVFESSSAAFYKHTNGSTQTLPQPCLTKFQAHWVKINLLAERQSRDLPRVFVEYSNLVKDWRKEVSRISRALGVAREPNEAAIDGFLTPELHHQRYTGPVTETFGYSWTTRVYSILSAAALDSQIDYASHDEIYHGFRVSSRAFRLAAEGLDQEASAKLLREFVDKLPIWTTENRV